PFSLRLEPNELLVLTIVLLMIVPGQVGLARRYFASKQLRSALFTVACTIALVILPFGPGDMFATSQGTAPSRTEVWTDVIWLLALLFPMFSAALAAIFGPRESPGKAEFACLFLFGAGFYYFYEWNLSYVFLLMCLVAVGAFLWFHSKTYFKALL